MGLFKLSAGLPMIVGKARSCSRGFWRTHTARLGRSGAGGSAEPCLGEEGWAAFACLARQYI